MRLAEMIGQVQGGDLVSTEDPLFPGLAEEGVDMVVLSVSADSIEVEVSYLGCGLGRATASVGGGWQWMEE